jgi:hypothetical protein
MIAWTDSTETWLVLRASNSNTWALPLKDWGVQLPSNRFVEDACISSLHELLYWHDVWTCGTMSRRYRVSSEWRVANGRASIYTPGVTIFKASSFSCGVKYELSRVVRVSLFLRSRGFVVHHRLLLLVVLVDNIKETSGTVGGDICSSWGWANDVVSCLFVFWDHLPRREGYSWPLRYLLHNSRLMMLFEGVNRCVIFLHVTSSAKWMSQHLQLKWLHLKA